MIILDAENISVRLPDKELFTEISVTIETGDRIGVVGINGCGKSTLLNVLAGKFKPDSGVIRLGRGAEISLLQQDPDLPSGSVRAAVANRVSYDKIWEVDAILGHLGMASMSQADVSTLSGGQSKRVALARTLLTDAELLVLDEPTNHLDLDAIAWLENYLAKSRSAVLMVSHDRHLLDRVCTKIFELDRGAGYMHNGGYQGYLNGKFDRESHAVSAEAARRNLAKRELAWLRRGAPARTRKSKARIGTATELIEAKPQALARENNFELGAASARSGDGQNPSASSVQGSFRSSVDERLAPRLGDKVIDLHEIGHRYGADAPWLFQDLSLNLVRGVNYGIVGSNGSGKSTLIEILAGSILPAEGVVELGSTVRVGHYDQRNREFDLSQRVRDAVAGNARVPGNPEDKKLLDQFWFTGDLQYSPIGLLSGGERRRLQLLMVLAQRPNVLLMDEPTNDLDLDTLRALEEFLESWPGTLVVVSHDRTFMDRMVDEVIAIEDNQAKVVSGGYSGWRQLRDANLASSSKSKSRTLTESGKFSERGKLHNSVTSQNQTTSQNKPASATRSIASHQVTPRKKSSEVEAANSPITTDPALSVGEIKKQLRAVEKELVRLGRERERIFVQLAELGNDYVEASKVSQHLDSVVSKLEDAENKWLELSMQL